MTDDDDNIANPKSCPYDHYKRVKQFKGNNVSKIK